ncbi:MAG: hypothetical protein WAL53_00435 [Nitrososphaeraceae archaeon]
MVAFLFISRVSALAVAIIAKKLNLNSFEKSYDFRGFIWNYHDVNLSRHAPKTRPNIDIDESD